MIKTCSLRFVWLARKNYLRQLSKNKLDKWYSDTFSRQMLISCCQKNEWKHFKKCCRKSNFMLFKGLLRIHLASISNHCTMGPNRIMIIISQAYRIIIMRSILNEAIFPFHEISILSINKIRCKRFYGQKHLRTTSFKASDPICIQNIQGSINYKVAR